MYQRKYNILAATGIKKLNEKLVNISNVVVVGECEQKSELLAKIKEIKPHIVLVSDKLAGDENIIDVLIEAKKNTQYVRFVYLAGYIDPNNESRINELGKLVLSGIFDICISQTINLTIIENIVKNPKLENDVSYLAKNIINNTTSDEFVKDIDIGINGLSKVASKEVMENVFVFTSIKPGTGKSFLSVNTACAIAKYGDKLPDGRKPRVALIESDLQTLSIGTILNIKDDKKHNIKRAMESISTIFDKGNLIGTEQEIYYVNQIIKDCLVPYGNLDNLDVLTGSEMTPEEVKTLNVSPEYYIYMLDVLREYYDVVIIDTNSSMFHVTTYPLLQKAKECYYILNLDFNNIKNNFRYYGTLRKLGLLDKIKWILNENIETKNIKQDKTLGNEKLEFDAEQLEKQFTKLTAKIPVVPKIIFLNRLYSGTPIVLDEKVKSTKDIQDALINLASNIYPISLAKNSGRATKEKKGLLWFLHK